jgi:hypothetical protein
MKNFFWPDIDDIETARKVAKSGAAAAFFVTIVTAVVAFCEMQGYFKLFGLGPEAFIDAGLFLIIGIGILFMSRIAALAGLALYGFEQYVMFQSGRTGVSILAIYFFICFVNTIRACFEYHTLKKQGLEEQAAAPQGPVSILTGQAVPETGAAAPEEEKKSFPFRKVLLIVSGVCFLIAGGVFAAVYFGTKFAPKNASTISAPNQTISEDLKGAKTFRMANGDTVRGRVTMEDPDFYIVQAGGKEEVLARTDIVSVE